MCSGQRVLHLLSLHWTWKDWQLAPGYMDRKITRSRFEPKLSPRTAQHWLPPKDLTDVRGDVPTVLHDNGPSPNTVPCGKYFKPWTPKLVPFLSHLLLMRASSFPSISRSRAHRKATLLLQDSFILIKVKCLQHHFHPQTINISGLLLSPGWQRWPPPCLNGSF